MSVFPVLVLSGWENLERHPLDAQRVLRKPADPVTLARAVDRLALRSETSGARPIDQYAS